MSKMYSYLMHSSRFKSNLYQRIIIIETDNFIMGQSSTTFLVNTHFSWIVNTSTDIGFYGSFRRMRNATGDSKISFFYFSTRKHLAKSTLSRVIFSYYHQTRGSSIQSMNDSWTINFSSTGKFFTPAIDHCINQGVVSNAITRMHNHTRCLIDNC